MPAALCILEFDVIPRGTVVADAMVKRAPLDWLRAGTVHPGKYLIMAAGSVAAVEEAHIAAQHTGAADLLDAALLPDVHEQVWTVLDGIRCTPQADTLGILESRHLPQVVLAADRAVKSANVQLLELRLGDGLGGKGLLHLDGRIEDVAAAIDAAIAAVGAGALHTALIPALHGEVRDGLAHATRFQQVATAQRGGH